MIERRFLSQDAVPLRALCWIPSGSPKAAMIFLHGLGEYGDRYREMGGRLSSRGILTVIPDLRGYGQSGGPRGHWPTLAQPAQDARALRKWIVGELGQEPFLGGHSLGGLLAVEVAANDGGCPPKGLFLSNPFLKPAFKVDGKIKALMRLLAVTVPTRTVAAGLPFEALCRDPEAALEARHDRRLFLRMSAGLWRSADRALPLVGRLAGRIESPLAMFVSSEDRVSDPGACREFFDAAASPDKFWKLWQGLYHEIFREKEKIEVIEALGDWILSHS